MNTLAFGSNDAFDALVYGNTSQGTMNYLRNQFSTVTDSMMTHGNNFLQSARDAVEFFNGSEAINFARSIIKTVKSTQTYEIVKYMDELTEMQNATFTMQRWIMTNPNVRQMYLGQKLDGYFGTYSNVHGNAIGDNHYDYRRVMDGIIQIEDQDFSYTEYFDELDPDDRELTFNEQVDIIHTWSQMDFILALGEDDPTSPVGSSL